jgi:hypothetical protein
MDDHCEEKDMGKELSEAPTGAEIATNTTLKIDDVVVKLSSENIVDRGEK